MANAKNTQKPTNETQQSKSKQLQKAQKPPSWAVLRGIFTCKDLQQQQQKPNQPMDEGCKKYKKMKCSGSLCSNTKVMHRPEPASLIRKRALMVSRSNGDDGSSSRSIKASVKETNGMSLRGMPFRRLSGCYECRMVFDPVHGMTRDPSLRSTICSCPVCGQIFIKPEYLELHQATIHAVSELGPEDTSKNIVEIIFQSSWLRKQAPICKIDRILKVHNTPKTISKFEEYRDFIKGKATKLAKKHPRCIADGNELLRFHCTTLSCSLGLNGSSNLCNSTPHCKICSLIKNGFKVTGKGILTTAGSGRAHEKAVVVAENSNEKRAMVVCRVIAGRVKKSSAAEGSMEEYDSVGDAVGVYSNLDDLYVFNPKAILPCFVVIYRGL